MALLIIMRKIKNRAAIMQIKIVKDKPTKIDMVVNRNNIRDDIIPDKNAK